MLMLELYQMVEVTFTSGKLFKKLLIFFRSLADHIILIGHTKDRTINREGKELSENLLDLSGKLERIISSKADALGYVYRKKESNYY